MAQKTPFSPIFDNDLKYGSITVGLTPGATPIAPCPTLLTIVGSVQDLSNLSPAGFKVAYTDGFVLVTGDSATNVTSVDVSTPSSPTVSDVLSLGASVGPRGMAMYGTYAVIGHDSAISIVDASDPTNLSITGTLSDLQLGSCYDIVVVGDLAYVATLNVDRLTIVDLSNPASPSIEGSVQNAAIIDSVRGVDVNGTVCYVSAFSDNRFVTLDVSNPASPTITGNVVDATNLSGIWAVAHMGDGLVACGAFTGDRFTIVDASTPATPTVIGSVTDTLLNGIRDIKVSPNGCVYCVSSLGDAAMIMDVSDPANPAILDSVTSGSSQLDEATGLAVNGSTLYVGAVASSRLTVVQGS